MRIYVCVKQVPDTSGKVAVNENGTLNRASMETIVNPDDLSAMEQALEIKDQTGCRVTAVTMGPPPAEGMLRELIAMGADDGVLISGRKFRNSWTGKAGSTGICIIKWRNTALWGSSCRWSTAGWEETPWPMC